MSLAQVALLIFVVILIVGAAFYVVSMYNRLIKADEKVENTWSDIDVVLKQRRDQLDKLVDVV
ncbi:MAG: LemA family protein, partial [Halobacteria archaeon]|nr:LemA family protein [Halobacteria archaeon]